MFTYNLRKKVETLFSKHRLKITAETGMKTTNYLDVTLDLSDGSYKPFRKDEQIPLYVNRRSNHPPAVTKNLPSMIERRVSNRCSTKQIFETHKRDYEQALKNSGYEEKIHYQDAQTTKRSRRPRYKQLFYFNPPLEPKCKDKTYERVRGHHRKKLPTGKQVAQAPEQAHPEVELLLHKKPGFHYQLPQQEGTRRTG